MFEDNTQPSTQLNLRVGDYASYIELLRDGAREYAIPDGKYKGHKTFDTVDLDSDDSFLMGLFKSWAAVLEVLTFYQQRDLNEGYLNTAKEAFSVHQLVSEIGYDQPPALAAQTWLAFDLHTRSTLREYVIPQGTQVQNVPDKGLPSVFETVDNFIGDPDWNDIDLHVLPQYLNVQLTTASSFCQFKTGPKKVLKKGDTLIICAELNQHPVIYPVEIIKLDKQKGGSSIAYWDHCLAGGCVALENVQIYSAPLMYRPFGYDGAPWAKTPAKVKQPLQPVRAGLVSAGSNLDLWQTYSPTPPPGDMKNIIELGQGHFVAIGTSGIWLSFDQAKSWTKSKAKNIINDILCMTIDDNGTLYIGCTGGGVFCSVDQGLSWFHYAGRDYYSIEEKKMVSGSLPKVNVNSLVCMSVFYKKTLSRTLLFCATSKGVFYTLDGGLIWQSGDGIFSYHDSDMASGLWAYQLIVVEGVELCVSTEKGFYYATINEKSLGFNGDKIKRISPSFLSKVLNTLSPKEHFFKFKNEHTRVYSAFSMVWGEANIVLLSSENGLFRLEDGRWDSVNQDLLTHIDGRYPRFYSFHLHNNILHGVSALGMYLSWDSGVSWVLQPNDLIVALPNLQQWRRAFDEQQLPSDFQSVMQR